MLAGHVYACVSCDALACKEWFLCFYSSGLYRLAHTHTHTFTRPMPMLDECESENMHTANSWCAAGCSMPQSTHSRISCLLRSPPPPRARELNLLLSRGFFSHCVTGLSELSALGACAHADTFLRFVRVVMKFAPRRKWRAAMTCLFCCHDDACICCTRTTHFNTTSYSLKHNKTAISRQRLK